MNTHTILLEFPKWTISNGLLNTLDSKCTSTSTVWKLKGNHRKSGKNRPNDYAVCSGWTIGIFLEWVKCSESVNGYKGCIIQGCIVLGDAVKYLASAAITEMFIHTSEMSIPLDEYAKNNQTTTMNQLPHRLLN